MHSFTLQVNRDIREILIDVKAKIKSSSGGYFNGDANNGEFSVSGIVGSYHASGLEITINILKKPLLISYAVIEKRVREYFI